MWSFCVTHMRYDLPVLEKIINSGLFSAHGYNPYCNVANSCELASALVRAETNFGIDARYVQ